MGQHRRPALSAPDLQRVHDAALWLLEHVGIEVLDAEALTLLGAHGAAVEGRRARLPESLVERARTDAPAQYTVVGRRPELDVTVGGEAPAVLGGAGGTTFVLDPGGGQRHSTLADLRTAVVLAHLSENISVHGHSVEPTDVPEERRARLAAHTQVLGSDKATRYSVATLAELQVALDVMAILYGAAWHEQPRLWTNINPTSPLQYSAEGAQALLRLARLGQPVAVSVCAMGGTTGPLTLAGLLALQHAELLAGLVLTQLAQPGCPFLYGGTSSLASMQTGALMLAAPEYWTLVEATVQLGHLVGVPVRTGGALTDAHLPDAQAGAESALGMAAALDAGADFVLHAGGILSSFNCYSPEKFVIDDEVLGALRTARRPVAVDEETLALATMAAVGPGGSLLGQRHTRRHAREQRRATLMNRATYGPWRDQGADDLAVVAQRRVAELLAAYEPPDDLDEVTRRQLDAYCLA